MINNLKGEVGGEYDPKHFVKFSKNYWKIKNKSYSKFFYILNLYEKMCSSENYLCNLSIPLSLFRYLTFNSYVWFI